MTFFAALALLLAGSVVIRGINSRIRAAAVVKQETLDLAVPSVAVAHPKMGSMKDEVVLPGNIQAFVDAPIYARTNGYLKKWYTDIGTRVKSGELIAEIESPEVDQQLQQARNTLATSQANLKLAEINQDRYQALWKLDSCSKQDLDNAVATYQADKATVAAGAANVKYYEQLVAFEKVTAPFDGVITARNTDVGQLINAGIAGSPQELFHISAINRLRIFVSVPQIYSRSAVAGVAADVTLTEFPGRRFTGKVARTSESIDAATRTLLTEVDVDNPTGQLLPGAFAEVHLKLNEGSPAIVVPVTALIFRAQGLQIAVVRGDKADLVNVSLGRDFGTEVEITAGITPQDWIIINPPDSLTSGAAVHPEPPGSTRE
ncbi:MAG TPA: efflux RND transporter periplasmic adaptor subunit [Bryobacteraceae bacterium]|nr:efflux RND transporter periplasmic adaptor subunit [Bryobacteraceae bacterium]